MCALSSGMRPASRSYGSRTSTSWAPSRSSSATRAGRQVRRPSPTRLLSLGFRVMDWTTRGKTVLITGAARGLGAETARRVAARGANVALVGLEPEELERVAAQCGPNAAWFECDVTDVDALERGRPGDRRALRRHRRGDGQRRHRAGGDDALDGPDGVRAHDRDQPARRVAHRARLPAARDRAPRLRATSSPRWRPRCTGPGMAAYCGEQGRRRGVRATRCAPRSSTSAWTSGVGYFGFIDTDMVRGADAHPALGGSARRWAARSARPIRSRRPARRSPTASRSGSAGSWSRRGRAR